MEWWKEPFFQVAIPIVIALMVNNFHMGKRMDDLRDQFNKRFDDINRRLDELHKDVREIKVTVQSHDKDIAILKERPPASNLSEWPDIIQRLGR